MKLKKIGSNQTELFNNGLVILFSYETPVAALLPSGRYIKTGTKYSTTTTRHVNSWLQGVFSDVEIVAQGVLDGLTEEVNS